MTEETMTEGIIELIPVDRIRIVNPRERNRIAWLAIVASIQAVGLKKPIRVAKRDEPDTDGNLFDLVCGQGRLEAFKELGEEYIPAIITIASKADQYLMSLIENIARRAPSNRALYFEIRSLLQRGYDTPTISSKLGLPRAYIASVVHLVEHGESKLIQEVEKGSLPVSVAVAIANGNDDGVQRALAEGYETGQFRGSKLKALRRLIQQRAGTVTTESTPQGDRHITGTALVKIYRDRIAEQQRLVARANNLREELLIIVSAMKQLFADEDFFTLLKAEGLLDLPEQLRQRIG